MQAKPVQFSIPILSHNHPGNQAGKREQLVLTAGQDGGLLTPPLRSLVEPFVLLTDLLLLLGREVVDDLEHAANLKGAPCSRVH